MSSIHQFVEAQTKMASESKLSEHGAKQVAETTVQLLDAVCSELSLVYESIFNMTASDLSPSAKLRRRSAMMRVSELQKEIITALDSYKEFVESK